MASPDPDQPTAPAAEADVLGEDARNTGRLDKLSDDGKPRADQRGHQQEDGSAKPGTDENQAGFVKDQDKKFSP